LIYVLFLLPKQWEQIKEAQIKIIIPKDIMEYVGDSVVEYRQPQPKGVKRKMLERQLISSVYWKGSLVQKKLKIGEKNEDYV